MASETTLILFKPDCVQKGLTGLVLDRYLKAGFRIRGLKMLEATDELLNEHYAHIASLPFFPEVQSFMKEAPIVALALEGEDAISRVRDILGPTDSSEAASGTIRGDFGAKDGDSKMRNICHASDSPEAAAAELKRFFGEGEVFA
ncbi:MAG: nucleoside-diphosphate kinase [Roseibacillus sp.]|nr:nucleoside-diphosphate kinase [Roseibacillus sp.]